VEISSTAGPGPLIEENVEILLVTGCNSKSRYRDQVGLGSGICAFMSVLNLLLEVNGLAGWGLEGEGGFGVLVCYGEVT